MASRVAVEPVLDSVSVEEYVDFEAHVRDELKHVHEKVDLIDKNVRGLASRMDRVEGKLDRNQKQILEHLAKMNGAGPTDA